MAYPRLDSDSAVRSKILPFCRLKPGEIWEDPAGRHAVGVFDAQAPEHIQRFNKFGTTCLMINDPPYNVAAPGMQSTALGGTETASYVDFTDRWAKNAVALLSDQAHFYLWLGASQNDGFSPLPEIMILMRKFPELVSRSFITLRNQRGYGTQQNWMAVRQELLYYVKGNPPFRPTYTDIPKILKGYYKEVGGERTENLERGKSPNIRPGNVWVDIQQVFYRMQEHVPGAYAQKPLAAVERIIMTCSTQESLVADLFAHSGTTLIACERLGRRCITSDVDPIFAELSIRRLERFRELGKTGWQRENPFPEVDLP